MGSGNNQKSMGFFRRLTSLSTREGMFGFLALDHGLTHGHGPATVDYSLVERLAPCAPFLTGVVLCPGPARSLDILPRTPLVVQCFGAPAGHTKVPLCTVEAAIRMGATAVAVQLDVKDAQLSLHIEQLGRFTASAHSYEIPVLFMTGGYASESANEIANAIRVAQELGADIIKVTVTALPDRSSALARAIAGAPPVLLAGAPSPDDLRDLALRGKAIGFSGYCVGRNIFQADEPALVASDLTREVFESFH